MEDSESKYDAKDLNKLRHRVKNLIEVADTLENVLPKAIKSRTLGGGVFANQMAMNFVGLYFGTHIYPFLNQSIDDLLKIIDEEITSEHFGKNSMFIKSMLYMIISNKINSEILIRENVNLKSCIKNINDFTGKLLK